jgi:hypothetical protein
MAGKSPPSLIIEQGTCYLLFAYDIARSIDLDEAARHIVALKQRESVRHKRRAPRHFEYHPAPLRVTFDVEPIAVGESLTGTSIDMVLYDFGAVLVVYTLALAGTFAALQTLSNELYEAAHLHADARKHVDELRTVISDALTKPGIVDFVEDYTIFQIQSFTTPWDVQTLCTAYTQEIAQILRAESQPLSAEEVAEALACRISYSTNDVTIIDWNATLMIDDAGDDVRAVLEFANVELLELRYLDRTLDDALDRSYEALSRRRHRSLRIRRTFKADLQDVARMQVDSAILFEGVNNALKLLGDQYLARVYRLVSQRFHLTEWDAGILRKLQTLESIYEKMSDQAVNKRMELLEWIIIVLIALSIVLPFLPWGYAH